MGTPLPSPKRGRSPPPKFSAHVYCVKTAGWIKTVLGVEVGLSPGDFVLDGDPAPSQKGGSAPSPIFGALLLFPNGWMHQDATWYGGRPQPRGLCVRWEPIPPKRGRSPSRIFGPCPCGQTAAWMKMPLGTKVGPGPDDIYCVRWGPSSALPKRGQSPPPQFSAHVYCGQTVG